MLNRDGENISVWQNITTRKMTQKIDGKKFDVIIIGGGITGVTTALMLQRSGKSCLIIEAHNIGYGTTSGTSAHLNTVLDTPYTDIINTHGVDNAKLVAQSAQQAIQIISSMIDTYHIDCDYQQQTGFMYAENAGEFKELMEIKEAILTVDLHAESAADIPVPYSVTGCISFNNQASFHPTKYLLGLVDAYVASGGVIVDNCRVHHVKRNHQGLQIETSKDLFYADKVVYATHTAPGVQLANFRLAPYRSYLSLFELDNENDYPQGLIYDMQKPFHYIRTVNDEGTPLLMVGGQDHKTAHQPNEKYNFLALESFVREHYHVKQKCYEWSSQYYESPDKLPYIGFLSDKNTLLATGFGGNGMIFGTQSAQIIHDLIMTGESKYQDLYNPLRVGPLSFVAELVSNNVDVVKEFITGKLFPIAQKDFAALAPGEGKVFKYEGEKVGVYKDEVGKLYGINPVCKHAGCTVKWNTAESSWDCPCHGARYSKEGKVLTGPTLSDLESWDFEKRENS